MSIKLIYASPETDANLLYWGHIFTADSFLAFEVDGVRCAISNYLEVEEMRRCSKFDRILLAQDLDLEEHYDFTDAVVKVLKLFKQDKLELPGNFPSRLLLKIQAKGIPFSVSDGVFLPERSVKKKAEIDEIKKACDIISKAFKRISELLSAAKIIDECLVLGGEFLTSKRLQREIAQVCFSYGAIAKGTIVACGKDSACPHTRGFGRLRANEFIVVDIFPRLIESGYYGDMTRTFLKGIPSEAQQKMYAAVKNVHDEAMLRVKAGVDVAEIHAYNLEYFRDIGYETTDITGFFHSTGHGVGLELHEVPNIGHKKYVLRSGEVITIEPGLYYPEIGGVRIEDVVEVRDLGANMLSNFSYNWVL